MFFVATDNNSDDIDEDQYLFHIDDCEDIFINLAFLEQCRICKSGRSSFSRESKL